MAIRFRADFNQKVSAQCPTDTLSMLKWVEKYLSKNLHDQNNVDGFNNQPQILFDDQFEFSMK